MFLVEVMGDIFDILIIVIVIGSIVGTYLYRKFYYIPYKNNIIKKIFIRD